MKSKLYSLSTTNITNSTYLLLLALLSCYIFSIRSLHSKTQLYKICHSIMNSITDFENEIHKIFKFQPIQRLLMIDLNFPHSNFLTAAPSSPERESGIPRCQRHFQRSSVSLLYLAQTLQLLKLFNTCLLRCLSTL